MNDTNPHARPAHLTQSEAARLAGVSVATWRRWENDPDDVSATTRKKCETALKKAGRAEDEERRGDRILQQQADLFQKHWGESPFMTPRQALLVAYTLDFWADSKGFILDGEPFHDGNPFQRFDLRVMMLINENPAWLKNAWQQCYSLSKLLQHGINPLRHRHCLFDELILLAAVDDLQDEPDEEHPWPLPPERVTDWTDVDAELGPIEDDDWERLESHILEQSVFDIGIQAILGYTCGDRDEREYGDPTINNIGEPGASLPHPYRWFDPLNP
ncbi:hypothetical protein [Nocardia lijiangensis]|uniref:hypothetical protein n=1 Tax=Nocardia lijiangensis TaxID=299618 RepID=UPI003D758BDA